MKSIRLLIICCAMTFVAHAQTVSFFRYYDAPFVNGEDNAYDVIQTSDLGYAFTGVTVVEDSLAYFGKMMLFKTNAAGDTEWVKKIGIAPGCSDANGYSLYELPDGYLIAGICSYRLVLVKTDLSGDTTWTHSFDYYTSTHMRMRLTPDGGCIITGTATTAGDSVRILKMGADGYVQWTRTYHYAIFQQAADVQPTADGGYLVLNTASSPTTPGLSGAQLLRLNASGDTLWTTIYSDTAFTYTMQSLTICSDGGYITSGGAGAEGVIIKWHADGTRDWVLRTPANNSYGIVEDTGNAWYSVTMTSSYQIGLQKIAYDGSGIEWSRIYSGHIPEYTGAFARTADHGFIITGYGDNGTGSILNILVKTDSDGNISSTGVAAHSVAPSISLFPDPAVSNITIHGLDGSPGSAYLRNWLGQCLSSMPLENRATMKINVSDLPAGVYTVTIVTANAEPVVLKFLKL